MVGAGLQNEIWISEVIGAYLLTARLMLLLLGVMGWIQLAMQRAQMPIAMMGMVAGVFVLCRWRPIRAFEGPDFVHIAP